MKIIYALMAACLSLQACNDQPSAVSTTVNENSKAKYTATIPLRDAEYTTVIGTPAVEPDDEYSLDVSAVLEILNDAEYVWVTGAIPGIKPIDGAEFEGTSRDDAYTLWSALPLVRALDDYAIDTEMDAEDHLATVTSPASKPDEEQPVDFFAAASPGARDDADNTASIDGAAPEPIPGYSVDRDRDFYVSDERFELNLTEEIDLHTIRPTDWW